MNLVHLKVLGDRIDIIEEYLFYTEKISLVFMFPIFNNRHKLRYSICRESKFISNHY